MASLIYTAEQLSMLPFLEEISLLKKQADSFKPLPKETEERVLQKFRLDWNYHSNAIEGNKLTYGETVAFIMEGVTAKGKTLKDHLDIKGHDEAVKYLIHIVKEKDYLLTEVDIRNLHQTILKEPYFSNAVTPSGLPTRKEIKIGQYKSSPNHVITPTGETHYYATPEDTPIKMGELMEFYKEAKTNTSIHPLVLAILFHHEFTSIHPFDDDNGRMARLLMNLLLMQEGYPPIVVKQDDRTNYYQVLRQADAGEFIPIVEYMSGLLKHSLNIYISGAKGESIEEEDDIDKEIALFKKGLEEDKVKYQKSAEVVAKTIEESIAPLFNFLFDKLDKFNDLFVETTKVIRLTDYDPSSAEHQVINQGFDDDAISFLNNRLSEKRLIDDGSWPPNYYYLSSFFINISFTGYKKRKPHSSTEIGFNVWFDEYYYSLFQEGMTEPIFQKAYGEALSSEMINQICKKEVKGFLEILKSLSQ